MDFGIINTTLQAVAKVLNEVRTNFTNFYTTKSLSDATKLTRVEPLTILSKDCVNLDYIQDVLHSGLNIFSGYYLQAVSMLTRVNNVEVIRVLDKLNPDRDETGFLLSESVSRESVRTLSLESYQYSLPTRAVPALEKDDEAAKMALEVSNLAVGKLLNVQISFDGGATDMFGKQKDGHEGDGKSRSVTIPISVRLMTSVVPNPTIFHLLASKTEDIGVVERYHAWRAGRISFIKDLIFCQDLIDEHKRSIIGDETGTVAEIMRRVNNSKKFGLITKNPSLVSASNIFVITEEIAREIESKLGGKLSNPKVREKAFENTYAMIIVVIDREFERVTYYTRGVAASTDLSVKEIKAASKGKGPDIGDILKSFTLGNAPTF